MVTQTKCCDRQSADRVAGSTQVNPAGTLRMIVFFQPPCLRDINNECWQYFFWVSPTTMLAGLVITPPDMLYLDPSEDLHCCASWDGQISQQIILWFQWRHYCRDLIPDTNLREICIGNKKLCVYIHYIHIYIYSYIHILNVK